MNPPSIIKCLVGSLIVTSGLLCLTLTACAQQDNAKTNSTSGKPLNEEATAAAWDSYNSGKYESAISNAAICIDEFRGQANRLQAKLEEEKAQLPTGEVSQDVKKKIFANGLLNDVAACYVIEGRSAEKLKHNEAAVKAYEEAKKYTFARIWDPKGWFWSPAENASDRLAGLK